MNSSEIFKTLCQGLKFPKQTNPTHYFKKTKPKPDLKQEIKNEFEEISESMNSMKLEEPNDSDNGITILSSFNTKTEKKGKKRKLESEDEVQRKKRIQEVEQLNHYRNVNKIKVKGKSLPPPAQTFPEFEIDSDLQENLKKIGFTAPTLIQQQAVPIMIKKTKPKPDLKQEIKNEFEEISESMNSMKLEEPNDCDNDITILSSFNTKTEKKGKKRKLESEDEVQRKKRIQEVEQLNHYRNVNKIKVKGKSLPPPAQTFAEFEIDLDLQENLKKIGFTAPTLIQQQAVPIMIKGKNLLALAPTGSGKTIAYLLPIIQKLKSHKKKGFRSLILCPTRELVKQIKNECVKLAEGRKLRIFTIPNKKKAIAEFSSKGKQTYDLMITTPGRLCLLLEQENSTLDLKTVERVVVDEADKLFEAGNCGFGKQLRQILGACSNENRKIAMFGATSRSSVSKWCYKNVKNLIQVDIGRRNTASLDVDQKLRFVGDDRDKLFALRDIIRNGIEPPVLIFVKTKDKAKMLFKELLLDGIYVDAIHADRTEEERGNTVRAFQNKKIWVLVCTELMARGIDFKNVNLVINFDFPRDLATYIHMVGRSGRGGQKGAAITFYNVEDVEYLRQMAHKLVASGCNVPEYLIENKKERKKRALKAKKDKSKVQENETKKTQMGKPKVQANKNKKTQMAKGKTRKETSIESD
ncbi:probable ATP-dependent RNA helicase DDX52 isoform X2 [Harmonia axyridis]|uniref:probable ATP-dependent RNA helicase DDX52 isoform X2 n=1 Tax=Harmonia axyridis TaxID=115357 RepID=UPI001E279761|nr:probable ATP-dependent RNA helicase DDX52 isoform X2 [Harmonia axyridis]